MIMTMRQDNKRELAEALLVASCAAHLLDLSAADREAVLNNFRALIDAYETVNAFSLPDEVEPANIFRALS